MGWLGRGKWGRDLRPEGGFNFGIGVVVGVGEKDEICQAEDAGDAGSESESIGPCQYTRARETAYSPPVRKIIDTPILRCVDICKFQIR